MSEKIWAAIGAARAQFGQVVADNTAKVTSAKGSYTYQYADLGSVLEAIMPALADNELILLQPVANIDGKPVVKTILVHAPTGEMIEFDAPVVFAEGNDPQKYGGGITYVRRYSLTSFFAMNVEDDDGQHARTPNVAAYNNTNSLADQVRNTRSRGDAVEEASRTRPDANVTNPPTDKQMGLLNAKIKEVFGDDMDNAREWMHSLTGKTSRTQLDKSDASKFIDWLIKDAPNHVTKQSEIDDLPY